MSEKKTKYILFIIFIYFFICVRYFFLAPTRMIASRLFLITVVTYLSIFITILFYHFELTIEQKFFILGLIFGLLFIFLIPLLRGIDETVHFYKVYSFFNNTNSNSNYDNIPKTIIDVSQNNYYNNYFLKRIDNNDTIASERFIGAKLYSPISYLFYLIPMFIFQKLINANIFCIIISGRLFGFLLWLIISTNIIKTIPKRKEFFAFLFLVPISLTLVTTYTGDLLTNISVFLFISIWYNIYESDRKITKKEIILITILGILSVFCKIVYALMFLIILLLPDNKFDSKKSKILTSLAIFIILIISAFINLNIVGKDMIEAYPSINMQKEFILTHPFQYLFTFNKTLFINFPLYCFQFITGYGTMCQNTISIDSYISVLYIAILGLSLFFDESKIDLSRKAKALLCICIFAIIFILFTSLYIQWTGTNYGIGIDFIYGIQGRYFIPLASLLIFVNCTKIINVNKNYLWTLIILINYIVTLKIICL